MDFLPLKYTKITSQRLSFDEYYIELAKTASLRADCTRSKVGAILVSTDHRCSIGYNGAPSGAPGCLTENACPRGRLSYEELPSLSGNYKQTCIAVHSERNAIVRADPNIRYKASLYVTRSPCRDCQLFAMANDLARIVWLTPEGKIASMRLVH